MTAALVRIEVELTISNNRGISCEKRAIEHNAQISLATEKICEGRDEREEMKATIEAD